MIWKQTSALIKKEFDLEFKLKYALNGTILYTVSTGFICYMAFNFRASIINPFSWNALFWMMMMFSALNAVSRSFMQESSEREIYYYSLCNPVALILSKTVYNTLVLILLSFMSFIVFTITLGNPVKDYGVFILNLCLVAFGLSSTLTLVSGIASKASSNNTLITAILGLPLVIPILLFGMKVSKNAIDGLGTVVNISEMLTIGAIGFLTGGLSLILFPYLWRS